MARANTQGAAFRFAIVATTAFLTLVDLFAAQAILPALTQAYRASPAAMSFAVNASTIGMAAGGLGVAIFGQRIDRRIDIFMSLGLLCIPTLALSTLPPLPLFTLLRIVQGVCMSSAFALTLAYLGERLDGRNAAVAFAAYITGNVASNLIGRLLSAGVADHLGLSANFEVFAALNIAGALLVYCTVPSTPRKMDAAPAMNGGRLLAHWRDPRQVAGFAIGFCILFAFIGTFTFVNFVLARPPLGFTMMQIGTSYFVFLPAIFTTPLAGNAARRFGTRPAMWAGLSVALLGLPLLLAETAHAVQAGMVLVAAGTFFVQAVATGYVSRVAESDRGGASGIYLASYFLGGMTGSIVLGQLFDRIGWSACVMGIGGALLAACVLTRLLRPIAPPPIFTATT